MTKKKKILIVEDEASIAMDLQSILEESGYDADDVAYSYNQAVNLLASNLPDLALLDIALKGRENGLDVARVIKEKYKIPFVFLTSFSDAETVAQAVDLKPNGYLVK
ncbi:MAG: response regulator, partial [Bacteroidota bacterium]